MRWLSLLLGLVACEEHVFRFYVRNGRMAPDNFGSGGITINDQFPGPTIRVGLDDLVTVHVVNLMETGLTMNWHGLHLDTNEIPHRKNATYSFRASRVGSFFYKVEPQVHCGGYGSIVVEGGMDHVFVMSFHEREYYYDVAVPILLSEVWHTQDKSTPDALLINGMGHVEWGGASNRSLKFNSGNYILHARDHHNYLLHLIAATSESRVTFWIEDHKLTVTMIDGTYVEPIEVNHVEIDPGQRISVLIFCMNRPANYLIHAQHDSIKATGLLSYDYAPLTTSLEHTQIDSPLRSIPPTRWIEDQLTTSTHYHELNQLIPPAHATTSIFLNITQDTKFHINQHNPRDFYSAQVGQDVQIVFQMYSKPDQDCKPTTWYLQGHSFHRVGSAEGSYDSTLQPLIDDYLASEEASTLYQDTFTHYPSDYLFLHEETYVVDNQGPFRGVKNCGWYAIRFKAENKGLWALESSILSHRTNGLKTKLYIHD